MYQYLAQRGFGMLGSLFAHIEESKEKKRVEQFGFSKIDDLMGSEALGIPHKYHGVKVNTEHIICYLSNVENEHGFMDVYSIEGKFLFNCDDFNYKEEGMFLVGNKTEDKHDRLYALYNQERKVSDFLYRGMMDRFNKQGFCTFSSIKYGHYSVVNKEGEVKYERNSYDHPYIYGIIVSAKDEYINLITGERICKKGYDTLSGAGFIFNKLSDKSVYQINIETGEYIIHGEAEKIPEPPAPISEVRQPEATKPSEKPQGRNEICKCGSGKKYKYCCINKQNN